MKKKESHEGNKVFLSQRATKFLLGKEGLFYTQPSCVSLVKILATLDFNKPKGAA